MKTLQLGKITDKELADWFGIGARSLANKKQSKLKELSNFASFHFDEKKHIVIDEIFNDTYSKTANANFNKVKEKIDEIWHEDGLDSCSRVSGEIIELLSEDKNFDLAESTVYKYTRKGRNELYGRPFMEGGQLGSCIYMWCKKNNDGTYSFLTDEEKKIKEDLQVQYFGDLSEKQLLVKGMVEAGEITKEEAWEVLERMTNMTNTNFMSFLLDLQKRLQCTIVRGTYVTRIEKSAF